MTRVELTRTAGRVTLVCRGHADGSPTTCAAVSALVYTAAGWARNCARPEEERLEPGDALLRFSGPGADAVFDLLRVGFLQLAVYDPARVSVRVGDGGRENR